MCQRPNGVWAWEASAADYNPGFICGIAGQALQEKSEPNDSSESLMDWIFFGLASAGLTVVGCILLTLVILLLVKCMRTSKQPRGGWQDIARYSGEQELSLLGGDLLETCVGLLSEREQHTGQAFVCDDNHLELQIDTTSNLGEGAFAIVHKGHWPPVGDVAVKVPVWVDTGDDGSCY